MVGGPATTHSTQNGIGIGVGVGVGGVSAGVAVNGAAAAKLPTLAHKPQGAAAGSSGAAVAAGAGAANGVYGGAGAYGGYGAQPALLTNVLLAGAGAGAYGGANGVGVAGSSTASAAAAAALKRRYPKGDELPQPQPQQPPSSSHGHSRPTPSLIGSYGYGVTPHSNGVAAAAGAGGGVPALNFGALNGGSAAMPMPMPMPMPIPMPMPMPAHSAGHVAHGAMPLSGYNPGVAHANKLSAPQSARLVGATGSTDASKPMTPARPAGGYSTARPAPATNAAAAGTYGYTPYSLHQYASQNGVSGAGGGPMANATAQPLPPAAASGSTALRHQSRGGGVRPLIYTSAQQPGAGVTPQQSAFVPQPPSVAASQAFTPQHSQVSSASYGSSAAAGSSTNGGSVASSAAAGGSSARSERKANPPMTPAAALTKYGNAMTPFEQSEILEYAHVYFVGHACPNKIQGIPHTANNNGYDDERGDYRLVLHDQLEYRYEVQSVLGRGSFGQVVRVLDHKNNMVLALKMIRNKKRFHHQALVEVKILEHLMNRDREHKSNIVRMYGYFYFRNHLCITFEPLSINLYEFIKNNGFKGVSLALIRRFAIQLLVSLKFLRRERIVHCDLKPENVLLKAPNKATIKLIDFGSSCFEDERVYTYIQSRFYRSPEVILGLPYDIAIDMWSFGCILSELYTGYPLFPGENETEQIQCIMEVLGVPPKRIVQAASRKKTFFDSNDKPRLVPNSRGKIRRPNGKDLQTATKCNDPNFISFLKKCLKWDPKSRLTPEKALEHPFITEVTFSLAPALSYKQPDGTPAVPSSANAGAGSATAAGAGGTAVQPYGGSSNASYHYGAATGTGAAAPASAAKSTHHHAAGSSATAAGHPVLPYAAHTSRGASPTTGTGGGGVGASSGSGSYDADARKKAKRLSSEQPLAKALFPPVGTAGALPALATGASGSSDVVRSSLQLNGTGLGLGGLGEKRPSGIAVGAGPGPAGPNGLPYASFAAPQAAPQSGAATARVSLSVAASNGAGLLGKAAAAAAATHAHAADAADDSGGDEYDDDDVATAAANASALVARIGGGHSHALNNEKKTASAVQPTIIASHSHTHSHAHSHAHATATTAALSAAQQQSAKKRSADQITKVIAHETGELLH